MRRLSSLAWRPLGARKVRSFLSMAGIALGVAVLFASLSAGASLAAGIDLPACMETVDPVPPPLRAVACRPCLSGGSRLNGEPRPID